MAGPHPGRPGRDRVCGPLQALDAPCLTVQWGNDQWHSVLPASHQGQLLQLVPRSDGLLVYRFELGLVGASTDDEGALRPPALGVFRPL